MNEKYLTPPPIPYGGNKPKTISDEKLKELIEKETEYRMGIYQRLMNGEEIEDKCKDCKWRKDRDEVFRRGVSMEDLCAACHIRSNRK